MKKILVPIDFSKCSLLALDVAADIAVRSHSEIYLLHIIELPSAYSDFSSLGEWDGVSGGTSEEVHYMVELLKATKKKMENVKNSPVLKGIAVHNIIEVGSINQRVAESAKKNDIDLVVMGSQGASGVSGLIVGSNAEKVVRYSKIPVLIIKDKYLKAPQNIVFASDFLESSDLEFNQLKTIADLSGAKIHILTVNTLQNFKTNKEMQAMFGEYCRRNKISNYVLNIYNDISTEEGIIHFANSVKADLIAIGTHGRKSILRYFIDNISEDIVNHAFCPVLTLNISKK